jgi:hypothetical protein
MFPLPPSRNWLFKHRRWSILLYRPSSDELVAIAKATTNKSIDVGGKTALDGKRLFRIE